MKKVLPILLVLLVGCTAPKVIERYSTGEPLMKGRYKDHLLSGETRSYYKNGQLWKIENYTAGEINGLREYYYEDYEPDSNGKYRPVGQLESRSTYAMGYQRGKEESFFRNGQRHTECYYSDEPSVWYEWYESGELKFEGEYIGGKGHGTWTYYYQDGKRSEIMHLVDGRQEGQQETWYPDGKLQCRIVYQDGIVSERQAWDQQGNEILSSKVPLWVEESKSESLHDSLMRVRYNLQEALNRASDEAQMDAAATALDAFETEYEEEFLDFIITAFSEGERDGNFKLYYATGEVKVITPRSKGEIHGLLQVFYKDGTVARSVSYKHNKEDGSVRCFYRDGKPEVEGQMLKGNRVGVWHFYNADGSLRETIDCDQSK